MDSSFRNILSCFSGALGSLADSDIGDLCEVRVRAGQPTVVYLLNRPYFVLENGRLAEQYSETLPRVSFAELKAAFERLCSFSVYKHIENMTHGFITSHGGHRIGVCATAVVTGGEVTSVTDITSLNIRRAREIKGCSRFLLDTADISHGALICGAPASGKTTLLRDMARILSGERLKRVSVIDERLEIASRAHGHSGFDVGLSDVYSGYPKGTALTLAVRTMSPEYVICDELTGADSSAVSAALNCGVTVISAVHCATLDELRHSPQLVRLVKTHAFRRLIFLGGGLPPTVSESCDVEEIRLD